MTDVVVAIVALVLGLMFLASASGRSTSLDRLLSVQRLRSRWGDIGVRLIHFALGLVLIVASAVIAFGWRLFPAGVPSFRHPHGALRGLSRPLALARCDARRGGG